MRTVTYSLPTVDFNEEYWAEYGPENEEGCNDGHLGQRYGSQTIQLLPSEVQLLTI